MEASNLSREDKDNLEEAAQSGPGTKVIKVQGMEITARIVGDEGKDPIYIGWDKKYVTVHNFAMILLVVYMGATAVLSPFQSFDVKLNVA